MQQVDKYQDRYFFDTQSEDPGGSEFDQLIEEAVVRPVEIEIAEQDEGDQGREHPGDDIGDRSVQIEGLRDEDREDVVADGRNEAQETVDPEGLLPFIEGLDDPDDRQRYDPVKDRKLRLAVFVSLLVFVGQNLFFFHHSNSFSL